MAGTWQSLMVLGALLVACKQSQNNSGDGSALEAPSAAVKAPEPMQADVSAPERKKGMVWIPKGTLVAGTPRGLSPRLADEELPGTPIEMEGFYIDTYPFPNESGAIPTTNVSRDDAAKMCADQGKRLCSELEWERACKGEGNHPYEYGPQYRAASCGTGVALEKTAGRTNGEYPACKSSFGVMDMHGGVWEWTKSDWSGRKEGEHGSGVLRGGNAKSGELVGRCANSIARPSSTKQSSIGFRCCAGPENSAEVKLSLENKPHFERLSAPRAATAGLTQEPRLLWDAKEPIQVEFVRAWRWRPVSEEELLIACGCEKKSVGQAPRCGVVIASDDRILAEFSTGPRIPDLIMGNDPSKVRARSLDVRGTFARDFGYVIGKVTVQSEIRP